jgi:hypothetical protein
MSAGGNVAPRGMTAHDRIRLTGPLARTLVIVCLDSAIRWYPAKDVG